MPSKDLSAIPIVLALGIKLIFVDIPLLIVYYLWRRQIFLRALNKSLKEIPRDLRVEIVTRVKRKTSMKYLVNFGSKSIRRAIGWGVGWRRSERKETFWENWKG